MAPVSNYGKVSIYNAYKPMEQRINRSPKFALVEPSSP